MNIYENELIKLHKKFKQEKSLLKNNEIKRLINIGIEKNKAEYQVNLEAVKIKKMLPL